MPADSAEDRYSCDHVVPIEQEPRHHLVIENEFVRAFAVEIAAGDRTLCHHHPQDYLLYVASGSEIISAARGEEPKRLNYCDGECEMSSAGMTHVVENLGKKPFRNVVVELSLSAGALRRGVEPKLMKGEANVAQVFDDERAAIFSLALAPGAELEIAGPSVVATPYGHDLNPDAVADIEVKRNFICDLGWIPAGRTAVLWGCRKDTERAIVFQLGRSDEAFSAVPKERDPLQSLSAHDVPE